MQSSDLPAIERALDNLGIEHGPLDDLTRNYHWGASDGQRVFVKMNVNPVGIERLRVEIGNARTAQKYGIPVPEPLMDEVVSVAMDDGRVASVAAFEYLHSVPSPHPTLIGDACVDILDRFAQIPVTELDLPTFDWGRYRRSGLAALEGVKSVEADELRAAVVKWTDLLAVHAHDRFGFIHGDFHRGNVMATTSGLVVVDWETTARGPIEVDLAQTIRTCADTDDITLTGGSYRRFRERVQDKEWSARVNWSVVELVMRARASSGTAVFLGRPNDVIGTPRDWALARGVRYGHLFD